MWTREVRIEDGKYSVFAQVTRCGKDISLTVGGGEVPHIGAAALAIPRPSLSVPGKISASVSVLCAPGHKEDEFVRRAAGCLAARFNCVVNISAGVHIERAAPEELKRLEGNLEALLAAVTQALESGQ